MIINKLRPFCNLFCMQMFAYKKMCVYLYQQKHHMKTIETLQAETINFVQKLPGPLIMKADVETIVQGIFNELQEIQPPKQCGVLITPESLQQFKLAVCTNIMNLTPEIFAQKTKKNTLEFSTDNTGISEKISEMFDQFIIGEAYQFCAQRIEYKDLKEIPTGTWASAKIYNQITIGQIYNNGDIYICQDNCDGAIADNKLGFKYSWIINAWQIKPFSLMLWTDEPTIEQVELAIKVFPNESRH